MIEANRIGAGREFTVVHGPYDPTATYDAVGAHVHFGVDTTSRVNRMLRSAVDIGLDRVTVTDHNTVERHEQVVDLIDRHGYPLDMVPGIEVTARGPKFEQRHIMVYGADHAPPPHLSVAEVNQWAHEPNNGFRTAVAHPELWSFSVMSEELDQIQQGSDTSTRFDWTEIANGASMRLDAMQGEHPWLMRLGQHMLPPVGSNDRMFALAQRYKNTLPFVGGDDSHEWDGVANVVNLVPKDMPFTEAVESGKNVVIRRTNVTGFPLWRVGLTVVKELPAKIREKHQRNVWARARG